MARRGKLSLFGFVKHVAKAVNKENKRQSQVAKSAQVKAEKLNSK